MVCQDLSSGFLLPFGGKGRGRQDRAPAAGRGRRDADRSTAREGTVDAPATGSKMRGPGSHKPCAGAGARERCFPGQSVRGESYRLVIWDRSFAPDLGGPEGRRGEKPPGRVGEP